MSRLPYSTNHKQQVTKSNKFKWKNDNPMVSEKNKQTVALESTIIYIQNMKAITTFKLYKAKLNYVYRISHNYLLIYDSWFVSPLMVGILRYFRISNIFVKPELFG